ncbi:MAG TPA: cyclic nucleotide-binding domain-containing protein [Anaeromyxobacteraceae bacterium]|nr:cyclic nucleotide-binding domain-containing protein [Anaeromyxobacteraceae bacterium]
MAVRPQDLGPEPGPRHVAALARSPLLDGLSADEIARLLAHAEPVEVESGTAFLREGDQSRDMYFVLEGQARLRRHQLALKTLGPGDHFGALALLTGRPRAASATAASRLRLARISPQAWESFAEDEPRLAMRIVQRLLSEVREDLVEMTDSVGALLQGRSLPRAKEVTVRVDGVARPVRTGTPVRTLLPADVDGALVVAGLLGQKPVSLHTPIFSETEVAPLTVRQWEGRQIYTRSVGLLLLEAARLLDPSLRVRLGPSRGTVQIVEVAGADRLDRTALSRDLLAAMERLVAADAPIRQEWWTVEEALAHFQERGWEDAARLLHTRPQATVPLVCCGDLYALSMGPLLPSTGSMRGFRLEPHPDGLLLDYGPIDPRNGRSAPSPPPREADMMRAHRTWLGALGVTSAGAFNDHCISGQVSQIIRVAEGFHEKRIGHIADEVAARRDRLRIICIAGPSSSGKTTFIKRLTVQLQVAGLNPVGLSLDDWYVDRDKTVRAENGDFDFEALEALDLRLLQDQVRRLLEGQEVKTARYDFRTGRSHPEGGPRLHLGRGDVLVLEGIHGLNPELLGSIPAAGQLFRVFIHPATTLPFDRLSRVSATDLRLLRRIVRDRHRRGYGAAENIQRWPAVQEGERRHIFPFQGEADVVFDSSLIYEPAVLKVFAERYLLEVPLDHPAFATALRLRHLIDRFVSIYPDHVPPTSIIREFIGGSGFEY